MDRSTAVLVLINAMQEPEKSQEDIQKEIDTLLRAVNPGERDAVLKEAKEKYEKLAAGLPLGPDRT
jgi:predicted transcriptional regulator